MAFREQNVFVAFEKRALGSCYKCNIRLRVFNEFYVSDSKRSPHNLLFQSVPIHVCTYYFSLWCIIIENACQVLQEYSKPNQNFVPDGKVKDIVGSILQIIDDRNYDNHNVRSRNGRITIKLLFQL